MTDLDNLLIFDLETTGVDPHVDRIVTAYLGQLNRLGELVQEAYFVVDPMVPIPDQAARVHGYTSERARAEANSTPYQLVTWLHQTITWEAVNRRLPLAGYNLQYDLTMLEAERARWAPSVSPLAYQHTFSAQNPQPGVRVLDAFVIDKQIDRRRKGSRKLLDTARHYGVPLTAEEAHGARGDSLAAGRIVQQQFARSSTLARMSVDQVHHAQIEWKREQAASLQEWFRSNGKPNEVVAGDWPTIPNPNERIAA